MAGGPTCAIQRARSGSRRASSRAASPKWGSTAGGGSGELGEEGLELIAGDPELALPEIAKRFGRKPLAVGELLHRLVDVEEPGDQLAACPRVFDQLHGPRPAGRVVVLA